MKSVRFATFSFIVAAWAFPTQAQLFVGTALDPSGTSHDVFFVAVTSGATASLFSGRAVWGATYDLANDRVLFTSDSGPVGGSWLWEWSVGAGAPNPIGVITVGGLELRIDGLAISGGVLYGSRAATVDGGIYQIDMDTLVGVLVLPTTDSISGIDADPDTGTLYGVDDTTLSLVEIDIGGGTITPVAAYPDPAETDIDGLAVGGGKAYLVPDDGTPGLIYVYDIGSGTWDPSLTAPWVAEDTYSGAALVADFPFAVYDNRPAFDDDNFGLPVEDFEEGNVSPGTTTQCPAPWDASTNNACFSPGQILPGIELRDEPLNDAGGGSPNGLVLIGPGFIGATSKNGVANTFEDSFVVTFSPPATAAGMDLTCYLTSPQPVHVEVLDEQGLYRGYIATSCTNEGTFFGVRSLSPGGIGSLIIFSLQGGAEGIDNVAFGTSSAVFVDGFESGDLTHWSLSVP